MVFIPLAVELAVVVVEGAEGAVLAAEVGGALTVGTEAAITASGGGYAAAAGRLGASLGKASNMIALGRFSGVLKAVAEQAAGEAVFNIAEWAWDKITGKAKENHVTVQHEACFATFDVRASKRKIEDNFTETYPYAQTELSNNYDLSTEKANGERVNVARVIGFWGVHIRIIEYDPGKLSKWRHPLDRKNFGVIAFCRRDVPIQESSIHFTE